MKKVGEPEKYFLISEFEEGWGMEDVVCEEQLLTYCTEVLFIPEEKIEELNMDENYCLEIILQDLEEDDILDDWYVNLLKSSRENYRYIQ